MLLFVIVVKKSKFKFLSIRAINNRIEPGVQQNDMLYEFMPAKYVFLMNKNMTW